jgi:transcriptional regulator with PAS, ATPase and Fis domain/ligand-binding sensor domain-containing protein
MGYRSLKRSLVTVLALACLWPTCFFSETVVALDSSHTAGQYIHDVWTTENGLPQNSVTALVQTRDGYLWVGTFGGLARFDGLTFKVFDSSNSPGLKSNRILSLFEDRAGHLWIGTEGGGLTRLSHGAFTTYAPKEGLPGDYVNTIVEDAEGNLWVGTRGGLGRLTAGRFTIYRTSEGLRDNDVHSLRAGSDGSLWFSAGGVTRFRAGTFTTYPIINGISVPGVHDIHAGRDGSIWIAAQLGVFRFAEGVFTTMAAYTYKTDRSAPSHLVVKISEDRQGHLSFLTPGGLARWQDGQLITTPVTGLSPLASTPDRVRVVFEDQEGNLWIGTTGYGLHRLKQAQLVSYAAEDGLSDESFVPITPDTEGGLWFAGNRLFRFHAGVFSAHPAVASAAGLMSLHQDRAGSIWVGGYSGLLRIRNGQVTRYNANNSGLKGVPVTAISEDGEGRLWIGAGAETGGLYQFKDGAFIPYRKDQGLVSNRVRRIMQDRQGALWIGTERGLSRFKDGVFTNYTTQNGLSHDYVREVYEDADGALWIGTYGGGLNRFKDGRFAHITTEHGLFDNVVSRILEDDHGNFWMSCNRGIYRASRRELNDLADGQIRSITCLSYGVGDGMKSSECNGGGQPAGWKTADGMLWFPTLQGVVRVDPNQINPLPPSVSIERALINQTAVDLGHPVEMPPGPGDLEISYTGLSFVAPAKVRFKYKLDGYDRDWVSAGARRVAYYTSLPPGRYTFRVRACNNDGVWNETGAAFEFSLAPYFYQTGTFYALWVAALALVGWAGYKWRVKHLERRTQELETIVADRTAEVVEQKNQLARTNDQLERANEQLVRANDDLLLIFNQWRSGVMTTDSSGQITSLSHTAEQLFELGLTDVIGQPWEQAIPLSNADKIQLKAVAERPPGRRGKLSVTLHGAGGQRYWMEIEVKDDPRDPRRKIFFLYDVSEIYDLRRLLDEEARFHDLVGASPAMQIVYKQIQDVAKMDTTVLIEGETGTGKELVARAIHHASQRKDRPFVAINCAGLTESLLTSQLFGHKRGAFTGATSDYTGLFEAANGGTLLLDEIGDVPMSVQTLLLRVLQEREITRLGESTPRKIDVRILAATNRDLTQAVASGAFRQDLLYRIRVGRIQLPALRRRAEDIPLLVTWFLGQLRRTTGKPIEDVSREAMELLLDYDWPGNVRELKSAVEYAVIHSNGSVIQMSGLPQEIIGQARPIPPPQDDDRQDEKQRIVEALDRAGGNRALAARRLGIGRTTLYRRMKALGIDVE